MTTKRITFDIVMEPVNVPVIDEWTNAFSARKVLSGDLIGESEGLFISAGHAEGMRSYIVIERLRGSTPEGDEAGVVLEHGGIENEDSAYFGRIVPGTGVGAWEGMTGSVDFAQENGKECMVLLVDNES